MLSSAAGPCRRRATPVPTTVRRTATRRCYNALTIDFEEWFQGLTSTSTKPHSGRTFESRIELPARWLLATLEETQTLATFFVLGQVARDHPSLVREVARAGHEIGLHGDLHRRVDRMSREEFSSSLRRGISAIEHACGRPPTSYRAPYFSLGREQPWFWQELTDHQIYLDSSVFPGRGLLVGVPGAPRDPYTICLKGATVQEFPLSTVRILGQNLPFSGGFYFRLYPYALIRWWTRRLNAAGRSVIFYFHPWELDPGHPRPPEVTLRERLSHYTRLQGVRCKLVRLLRDHLLCPLETLATRTSFSSDSSPRCGASPTTAC